MKLLLASNSPRRKELLSGLGYDFDIIKIDADESYPKTLAADTVAAFISEKKASYFSPNDNELLITSDTVVALEKEILLKPETEKQAFEMLKKISGKTHKVHTAFSIKSSSKLITRSDSTLVTFSEIDDSEIEYYIKNFRPFDKAGSYGIQEWLGMAKITSIQGSFYTVMGLPVHLLYEELKNFKIFP